MKRIVAALQMLIFGAVGLQIRPSRLSVYLKYAALRLLVCHFAIVPTVGTIRSLRGNNTKLRN